MKITQRILAAGIAALLVSGLNVSAEPEPAPYTSERGYRADYEHETHDGFYMHYSVEADGSAVFEGIDTELSDSDSTKLTIPKTLGGHTVKSINSAFPYNYGSPGNRKNDF